ncbi:MAG: PLP-dependent cysteine synthase family protein [Acidobacteria bacterium]|nr:PLP-dependent cysteine synthase family protein [Acidobacteriota bacterium]
MTRLANPVHPRADLLRAVGNTPLVELTGIGVLPTGVRLFAKLESCNPGGSIKDRPVARMLTKALEDGHLRGGRRLLDSSSGNAGIAYAQFGAALGVEVTLVVPGNASQERLDRIAAHGAELILTDPLEGYDFALREAKRLAETYPDKYWYSNQYANEHNWRAHYETTGREILEQVRTQTGGAPSAFVAGIGTGGTITGVGRCLLEADPGTHVVAVIPEDFPGIEGLKPLGRPGDIVPDILDESIIDERTVMGSEPSLILCRRLASRGLFAGPSSGANVAAALRIAGRGDFSTVVTVLSDGGGRYGSTGMWRRSD